MKKNSAFTICAKNYIGLAQILGNSLQKVNPDVDYYIFVADELSEVNDIDIADNVIECKSALKDFINTEKWEEMSFKYNLTEFCTSIKALCYKYLFEKKDYEKVIFLDPDIYVFSSFDSVFLELETFKIILAPHITTFGITYKGARSEKGLLSTGVFNLGFLALRRSEEVNMLLNWWGERLKEQCYIEPMDGLFTDQKWMDFLPCFFDNKTLCVSGHLGINVAPWNFFEREIYKESENWRVKIRQHVGEENILSGYIQTEQSYPLVFVHFSGYDYQNLIKGNIVQNNIQNLGAYNDIDNVCKLYGEVLQEKKETFNSFIKYSYTYSTFKNGVPITHFNRRIFRSLIEEGKIILSPFSVSENSFYSKLLKKKMLSKSVTDNIDKLNKLNMPDTGNKLAKINWLMSVIYQLIGIKNYALMLRLMRPYSRVENQTHLLDNKYSHKLK